MFFFCLGAHFYLADRRNKHTGVKEKVKCPQMVCDYNVNMGYVDMLGQRISPYATNRVSKKWWKSILFWLFDVAAFNAYLIHQHQKWHGQKHDSYRMWLFRLQEELRGGRTYRKASLKRKSYSVPKRGELGHYPVFGENQVACEAGCLKRTTMKCAQCGNRLCKQCWATKDKHSWKRNKINK